MPFPLIKNLTNKNYFKILSENQKICVKFFTYSFLPQVLTLRSLPEQAIKPQTLSCTLPPWFPVFASGILIIFYQYARISPFIKGVVSAELAL